MDSNCHIVTNAEHCTESIGTRTQVSNLTKEFHRMTFFLQRISVIASTQHLYFTCLNLGSLTEPIDSVSSPFTLIHAPVVMSFNISSSKFDKSTTICTLFIVEPSFRAIKFTCLLPRRVRTQPFTLTIAPKSRRFNRSTTFVLLIFPLFCLLIIILLDYSNEPIRSIFTSCSVR